MRSAVIAASAALILCAAPAARAQQAPPATPPSAPANRDAEVVERILPEIPKSLWTAKYGRTVRVRVDIAADGRAKTELTKGSGNADVDRAVLGSLRKWRWKPAVKEGKPAATRQEFDLKLGSE